MSCGARDGRLAARERQQVADDPRGTLRLLGDAPQVVGEFRRRPDDSLMLRVEEFFLEQLRVPDHARQRVVQLVRDARDELPDCRQLLRLEQLRLRRLQTFESSHRPRVRQRELVAHQLHAAGRS